MIKFNVRHCHRRVGVVLSFYLVDMKLQLNSTRKDRKQELVLFSQTNKFIVYCRLFVVGSISVWVVENGIGLFVFSFLLEFCCEMALCHINGYITRHLLTNAILAMIRESYKLISTR
jgi:hypothetical protein